MRVKLFFLLLLMPTVFVIFSGRNYLKIPLATLSYDDKIIETYSNVEDMYIKVDQVKQLLNGLEVRFEDYGSGIHVLPFEQKMNNIPREYELYGYWVAVRENEVLGFQFQSSDEWGAYTIVLMSYNANVNVDENIFNIKELKYVKVGSYFIKPDSSLTFLFKGVTYDFESPFTICNEIESWSVSRNKSGFIFNNGDENILISPVEQNSDSLPIVE